MALFAALCASAPKMIAISVGVARSVVSYERSVRGGGSELLGDQTSSGVDLVEFDDTDGALVDLWE